ncbi:hypothetical protein J5N97_006126 [Dioscorea zingiberensis]|uniref:FAS1 domain-containing protein n=1 Tax=Dioscorea zingiberensis TaxID=325984 RepID=A0A9D5D9E8_9LILI|nr:hypothetical protein J5N97_006126 [Dioscorea zingiberensis]
MGSSPRYHPISHYTPIYLLILLVIPSITAAINITSILAAHPDLSDFERLLATTGVANELSGRSSLTLLVVPNSNLARSSDLTRSAGDIADVLRYHVLLEYLSWSELRRIPASGKLVTTLYQTTGRAASNLGSVNITRSASGVLIARSPAGNATVLSPIATFPYNASVLAVDALLIPPGFDLAASETRPPPAVNISRVLSDGHDFNVAASMLAASGVAAEFEADERGAGITVFVPTDEAFAELPATERLQSLPADRKAVVLRFHVLHSYYPLGSLESIVNPVQPTLATEDTGAGRFTLNISRVNGSVAIDTGVIQASITRTVFDQNPVAVFAVSRVLLPREIFAKGAHEPQLAPPPLDPVALSPDNDTPPTRLSSPPGLRNDIKSGSAARSDPAAITTSCIAILYLLLLLR